MNIIITISLLLFVSANSLIQTRIIKRCLVLKRNNGNKPVLCRIYSFNENENENVNTFNENVNTFNEKVNTIMTTVRFLLLATWFNVCRFPTLPTELYFINLFNDNINNVIVILKENDFVYKKLNELAFIIIKYNRDNDNDN